MAWALSSMGGVKCQPFRKQSNHWKWALKMILREVDEVVNSTAKAITNAVQYKFSQCYRSRNCYNKLR